MNKPVDQVQFERLYAPIAGITPLQRAGEGDGQPDPNRIEITWSTGYRGKRRAFDWESFSVKTFEEELDMSDGAVRMERLNSGNAPFLDSHASWQSRTVIGVIESAEVRNGIGTAVVRLTSSPDNADAVTKIREGILKNVSVGYNVHRWEIQKEDDKPELWIARDWEPMEISIVPIGFDPTAQVNGQRSENRGDTVVADLVYRTQPEKETPMSDKTARSGHEPDNNAADDAATRAAAPAPAPAPAQPAKTEEQIRSEAQQAERARINDIHEAVRDFGFDEADAKPYVDGGKSADEVRRELQKKLAERTSATPQQRSHVTAGGQNEFDTRRSAVTNALEHTLGVRDVQLSDAGRQYRGMSLWEMAKRVLEEEGVKNVHNIDKRELASYALGMQRAPGMMSTSDFPNILGNTIGRRMREYYGANVGNWRRLARQSNAPDFKSRAVLQLQNDMNFKKVAEGGEFEYAKMSEAKEEYALATYGKIVPITRQALINDDLGAFDRMARMHGAAAARLEAGLFWAIFTGNPTMGDGTALFHANHGNLAGSGGAIAVSTIAAGRKAIATQKVGEDRLNIQARYLIVPWALEATALQFIAANMIPAKTADANPYANSFEVITEALLDDASATAWYLSVDPNAYDTIEYAYLEGEAGLYTESRMGFEVDGLEVKGRLDFAAKAIDWRGLYKNAGA